MKEITLRVDTYTDDDQLKRIIKLLKAYNKTEIEFSLDFCELEDVIKYYINSELDIDLDEMSIFINIYNSDSKIIFDIDTNGIENNAEYVYLFNEFKKHFGSNILKCDIKKVLRIVFIDCCSYELHKDYIKVIFSADNLDNWLFKYFNSNS